MPQPPFPKVVLLGAGKVGGHLALRLQEQGITISQVYSRKKSKAQLVAKQIGSRAIAQMSSIDTTADLYILAISDDAICEVAGQLSHQLKGAKIIEPTGSVSSAGPLIVHTSGATPSTILKPFFKRYGILYPLQSFSPGRVPDFNNIPICIFANRKVDRQRLMHFAKKLSPKVVSMDDKERAVLHVAAVFVNNFANYMYQAGEKIAAGAGLDFDHLKPLIAETAAKIMAHSPAEMQTGPALRGDKHTMQQHLEYLENRHPEMAELYSMVSELIRGKE